MNGQISADCKRGRRKGATSKNVKNRQKVSKSFSTLFDNFRAGQKTSKIVKKCQKVFRQFSTIFARHLFSGPFAIRWKSCFSNRAFSQGQAMLRLQHAFRDSALMPQHIGHDWLKPYDLLAPCSCILWTGQNLDRGHFLNYLTSKSP